MKAGEGKRRRTEDKEEDLDLVLESSFSYKTPKGLATVFRLDTLFEIGKPLTKVQLNRRHENMMDEGTEGGS